MNCSLFLLLATAALGSACNRDAASTAATETAATETAPTGYAGFLYTSTNATDGNGIIAMGRNRDGTVTELPGSPYPTGAAGAASGLDTQWALRIVGDYLLTINAGANPVNGSISVFKFNRTDGSLSQVDQNPATPAVDNADSRGVWASTLASTSIAGTTWVVVGNQHSSLIYAGSPPQAEGAVRASTLRNLVVFTLDPQTGVLAFNRVGPTYESGQFGGPVSIEFSPDGTKLSVATFGVLHSRTPDPDLKLQKPGRLYVYEFATGALTQTGMFEEVGVSGNTSLSWSPNGRYVYMANANLHASKEDQSVTVHDGTTAAKVQNFITAGRNDEACWTLISRDHTKFYVASHAENVVSVFDIGADGKLTQSLTPNFFARQGGVPKLDAKDMYEASGGYLYVLGAGQSHTVTTFKTSASGTLTEEAGSPYRIALPVPVSTTGKPHLFQGFTGFEK